MQVSIYRKPTTVNWTITSSSCHAPDHKLAAVRYVENWVMTYSISESEKKKRNENNKKKLHNNQYMTNLLLRKAKKKGNNNNNNNNNNTWIVKTVHLQNG